ncbi:MAG TPA: hypothetical protein VGP72_32950 [Planctomycetota bacterium]|jgi:hypothetical protein
MAKRILFSNVRVPECPRVRFMRKTGRADREKVEDVTGRVIKLIIEDSEDGSDFFSLLRLDVDGNVIWRTRHPSMQETKWQAEFEYGLPEERWEPCVE